MSLGAWIKTLTTEATAPQKNDSTVVAESLLMELEYQMREIEANDRLQEQEDRRAKTGVDYSWLVTEHPKPYEMPQLDRLELEELCMKVKPEESGRVITEFRNSLLREPSLEELPRLMRACILQVLEGRPKEDTMTEWMMKSITKLRPSSRVVPIGGEESAAGGDNSNNVIELKRQPKEDPLFLKVDNLPV